jgi:hypothetical protein
MVVIDERIDELGHTIIVVSDEEKIKGSLTVYKTRDGFALYAIRSSASEVPKQLKGKFTRSEDALNRIKHYLKTTRPTAAVRRDATQKRIKEHKEKTQ